ncbi:peroxiredoxin, partial [Kitasatospora herbaricolor]
SKATPFIECLGTGHVHSDECPASLAAYRDGIADLDHAIATLTARRDLLARRLDESALRGFPDAPPTPPADFTSLPSGLPRPVDDGAADHLPGVSLPSLVLPTTDGRSVDLSRLGGPASGS